jgi:hypothetical protein
MFMFASSSFLHHDDVETACLGRMCSFSRVINA